MMLSEVVAFEESAAALKYLRSEVMSRLDFAAAVVVAVVAVVPMRAAPFR